MRWVFIGAGLTALSASTTMALNAAGGLSASVAPGLIAMAFMLAVGAAAVGHALARRHVGLALVIGLGMIAGEVGAMIQTAQRVTAAREAQRAPFVALEEKRKAAIAELTAAEAAKPEPAPRTRLEAAIAGKAAAERTVAEKAAEKGCRENCRMLLQAAVDAASREAEAARVDIEKVELQQADAIATRLANAKTALAALPPPQSATPLADYSGAPEWLLDVLEALALSLAINLPASALVALGVKMSPGKPAEAKTAPTPQTIEAVAVTPRDHAVRFGIEVMAPSEGSTPVAQLHSAYVAWCRAKGHQPFAPREIGRALLDLFGRTGVEIGEIDGRPHVLRARIRDSQEPRQRALGRMTTVGVQA